MSEWEFCSYLNVDVVPYFRRQLMNLHKVPLLHPFLLATQAWSNMLFNTIWRGSKYHYSNSLFKLNLRWRYIVSIAQVPLKDEIQYSVSSSRSQSPATISSHADWLHVFHKFPLGPSACKLQLQHPSTIIGFFQSEACLFFSDVVQILPCLECKCSNTWLNKCNHKG